MSMSCMIIEPSSVSGAVVCSKSCSNGILYLSFVCVLRPLVFGLFTPLSDNLIGRCYLIVFLILLDASVKDSIYPGHGNGSVGNHIPAVLLLQVP